MVDATAAPRPDRPVLLYDGQCHFCRACANAIARLDRRRRYAVLLFSHQLAAPLLALLAAEERTASMHIVTPGGHVVSAGRAVIELAGLLPGGSVLSQGATRSPAALAFAEWLYRRIAGSRRLLSRLVPDLPAIVRAPVLRP